MYIDERNKFRTKPHLILYNFCTKCVGDDCSTKNPVLCRVVFQAREVMPDSYIYIVTTIIICSVRVHVHDIIDRSCVYYSGIMLCVHVDVHVMFDYMYIASVLIKVRLIKSKDSQ